MLKGIFFYIKRSRSIKSFINTSTGQYNISKEITVSGISGGGGFSKLIAFVFSSIVRGVGMFTAGPFPVGIVAVDNTANMLNASHYIAWIDYLSSRGFIDDTRYLRKLRVYFHHGMADYIAPPCMVMID